MHIRTRTEPRPAPRKNCKPILTLVELYARRCGLHKDAHCPRTEFPNSLARVYYQMGRGLRDPRLKFA